MKRLLKSLRGTLKAGAADKFTQAGFALEAICRHGDDFADHPPTFPGQTQREMLESLAGGGRVRVAM